jgi:quercetin dioxygenase-like cupin family protein
MNPFQRSSLHSHRERYELFHFLDENAQLELEGKVYSPHEHDEFLIKPGIKHRFWAKDTPFRMLVICFGEWRAEDQYRHDDDYGRKGKGVSL